MHNIIMRRVEVTEDYRPLSDKPFQPCDADGSEGDAIAGHICRAACRTSGLPVMEVVEYLVFLSFGAYEVIIFQSEIAADERFRHIVLPHKGGVLPS